jgi:hypothetical protein
LFFRHAPVGDNSFIFNFPREGFYKVDLNNKTITKLPLIQDAIMYHEEHRLSPSKILYFTPKVIGLIIYDDSLSSLKKVYPRDKYNTIITLISSITSDKFGRLWVFTDGYGVHCIDMKTMKAIKSYTTQNGLSNNYVGYTIKDKNGNIWVHTLKGLHFINVQTLQIFMISKYGYNTFEEVDFIDPNKRFMLIKSHGKEYIFDTDTYLLPVENKGVQVMKVELNGQLIKIRDNKVNVENNVSSVDVFFRNKKFYNGSDNQYFYKMEYDQGWSEILNGNKITLNNLKPKLNTLIIKVCYKNGECLEEHILDIYKKPTLVQRSWFWPVLMSLFLLGLVFLFFTELKRRKLNIEKLKAELQFLQTKMDPHFIFNSLNSINRFILKSDKLSASEYLSKFAKLIRSNLDNSSKTVVPLAKEIELLKYYIGLETLRFQRPLAFQLQIDNNLHLDDIQVPPLIIQPFLENAIWHGLYPKQDQCKLILNIQKNDKDLMIKIEDNGIGRQKAAELKKDKTNLKTSIGINTTLDRLLTFEKIYGVKSKVTMIDKEDEAGVAQGTTVIIIFYNSLN